MFFYCIHVLLMIICIISLKPENYSSAHNHMADLHIWKNHSLGCRQMIHCSSFQVQLYRWCSQ